MNSNAKIGLFGTGLDTYWGQFDGLLDELKGYQARIRDRMERDAGVQVADAGMVDSPARALEAASLFVREQVDLVFLYMATYCLSSTILPVVQRLNCPVVVLNLQPTPAIDYERLNALGDRGRMTGMWLANCQACSAPEIASVLARSHRRCAFVTGWLDDPVAWRQIGEWIAAAGVCAGMRRNRLGVLGHYYGGMLDVYTDLTRQSAVFGTHVELLEMCELHALRERVTDAEVAGKIAEFRAAFEVSPECEQAELERAARTSVALDRLVAAHGLGAMAYYYEGAPGNDYERIVTSVIAGNTLLTGRGIPVAGECEVKNAQAMKILSLLGAGGSFSEFYALDFDDDIVMLGHDGPAHFAIAEGAVGSAAALPRQARQGALDPDERQARPRDAAVGLRGTRWGLSAHGRGRVGGGADAAHRQYQQPLPLRLRGAPLHRGVEPGRPVAPLCDRYGACGRHAAQGGLPAGYSACRDQIKHF